MPNWCDNDLTICGAQDEVARFLEHARRGEECFDFEQFVPRPETVKNPADTPTDVGTAGEREWAERHWGTKWNVTEATVEEHFEDGESSEALINFSTAWSPPIPVVLAASEQFPKLTLLLRYYESNMGFHGRLEAQAGRTLEHDDGPYFGDRGG